MKSCHFDNMNESRGYFAEQNKPRQWKTNTAYSLLCVESKKKKKESKIIETEQMSVLQKGGVWGK